MRQILAAKSGGVCDLRTWGHVDSYRLDFLISAALKLLFCFVFFLFQGPAKDGIDT